MTRFTEKSKGSSLTTNYEGAPAYKLDAKTDLYSKVCTASLSSKFYERGVAGQLTKIRGLIKKVNPEFVAKLAVYARENMYLRSISLVLCVEMLRAGAPGKLVAKTINRVIQRADELYEILGYYALASGRDKTKLKPIARWLKEGVREAFNKFDEYQFAKYDRPYDIKLRDALFLTYPEPKADEEKGITAGRKAELFAKIAAGKLEIPYTWETELSEKGNTKEVWEELIDSRKVGYMALLRNLRNIVNAKVDDEHLEKVLGYLSNEDAVLKARQLPFRYLSAYRELVKTLGWNIPKITKALEEAMKISARNIKGFDSDTGVMIACDMSASMQHPLSERSTIQLFEVGIVLGMMLQFHCKKVMAGIFGQNWKLVNLATEDILRNSQEISNMVGEVGHSTNGWKILDWAIKEKLEVDKWMFFTDCQWWSDEDSYYSQRSAATYWREYKKLFPNSKAYYFDLAGYGTTPLSVTDAGVYFIAGWSEKVFDVLDAIEKGSSAVKEIEAIEL